MNHQIITNIDDLYEYIDVGLPILGPNEKFYFSLFVRRKYDNQMVSVTDKAAVSRFTSDKSRIIEKIRKLEVQQGTYKVGRNHEPATQKSLALYMTPNPRDLRVASYRLIGTLASQLEKGSEHLNPHQEALTVIHKCPSKSNKKWLIFDLDSSIWSVSSIWKTLEGRINLDAVDLIKTHGGYHIMVKLKKINDDYRDSFFKNIRSIPGCDQVGDLLSPVPGCTQGGFTPKFIPGR